MDEAALGRAALKFLVCQGEEETTGSGFVLALQRLKAGLTLWAVTCYHVAAFGGRLRALLQGRCYAPQVEALYPHVDLALLKIRLPRTDGRYLRALRPLLLGDPERAAAGQSVFALGFPPEAEEPKILPGSLQKVEPDCLEFGCEGLCRGYSGGALLDRWGRVLGIIEAVDEEAHTGYAIPSSVFRRKALQDPLKRALSRCPWGVLRFLRVFLKYGLLIGGVLFLLGVVFLQLTEPFSDRALKLLAPQLSRFSYTITYESGASLKALLRSANPHPGEGPSAYMEFTFRGEGGADAGWVIVVWDKLFQNTIRNLLHKLRLEEKIWVRGRNLEGFEAFTFRVRGLRGGEPLGVGVKWIAADGSTHEVKLLLAQRAPSRECWAGKVLPVGPLTTDWQTITLPLEAFGPVDWSSVENISFFWRGCFLEELMGTTALTLDLGEIRLEKSQ